MPLLTIENLSKNYTLPGVCARAIFNEFSLSIAQGSIVAIVGPNGCGKTTLLNCIAGLTSYENGVINTNKEEDDKTAIGFVFQNYRESLLPWLSNIDNIACILERPNLTKIQKQLHIKHWATEHNIVLPWNTYPYQCSGGQQQLVVLVRELINQPKVLLMDEPFAALDYEKRLVWHQRLLALWEKTQTTIVLISHDLEEAVYLADEVIVLGGSTNNNYRAPYDKHSSPTHANLTSRRKILSTTLCGPKIIHASICPIMKLHLVGILIILLAWEILSLFVDRLFLPSPWTVTNKLVSLANNFELYNDIWATLKRASIGITIGTVVGVILGTLLGAYKTIYSTMQFPIDFIRSIPATALFPLFIVLFGLGDLVKIFVSAWAMCSIVFINTLYGFQNISNTRRLFGKLKKFSFLKTVRLIIIPSALPHIAAGIRVGLSFALIIELVAEMFLGSQNGLGHRIFAAASILAMEEVYVGIILIGILGYGLNSLTLLVEHKIIHWSGKT